MNKIFTNAAVTYARSLVALALGLFSSRWVLSALGTFDFGLYAVVGSVVTLFAFLGGLLNVSVARHYAFSIGTEEGEQTNGSLADWFVSALVIHVVLILFVIAVGWPVGELVVRRVLIIPAERLETCVNVFRLSLVAACANMLAVPFGAMYVARQKFVKLAMFGLTHTFFLFFAALWLLHADGNRLLNYACYMTLSFMGLAVMQIVGAVCEFPACRVRGGRIDHDKMGSILSFAGWTLCGGAGLMLANHGAACVTNRFFGAVANAAYGVAQQVQYHTEALANALIGAFEPATAASEGAGNHSETTCLAYRGGVLGTMMVLFFAVPLTLELPTVLKIWLGQPPPWTVEVCTILLAAAVVNRLMMGQHLAFNACGRIARWQITCGVLLSMAVPAAVVFTLLGVGVLAAAWAFLAAMTGSCVASALLGARLVGLPMNGWLRQVVFPAVCVGLASLGCGALSRLIMPAGFLRVCVTALLSTVVFALWGVSWWKRLLKQKGDVS